MKKGTSRWALLVAFLLISWLIPSPAAGGPPDNYTAKMVQEGMSMDIAKMGKKTRTESSRTPGMVTLSFPESGKMILMSTANKTYLEQALKPQGPPSPDDPGMVIEKKQIGTETINGHSCNTYDAVFYPKERPGEKFKAVIWEATDLGGLMIRSETILPPARALGGKSKVVRELKEIQIGAAKSSLFEVPKDYRRVENMVEAMGGVPKMDGMSKGTKEKK